MALAEVVVCAVGRVVTLPAVEITAQATALLVLVMLSAARTMAGNPLCFAGRGGAGTSRGAPMPAPRGPLVSRLPGGRRQGGGVEAMRGRA